MPSTHHVGFAGEAAVASEFSIRGYVVSMPMIDLGNDLFVENHATGAVSRIQVKTAMPRADRRNYFQFSVRETAIHAPTATVSHFAFVVRSTTRFHIFMIAQPVLSNYANRGMGSHVARTGVRTFTFIRDTEENEFTCSGVDITHHRNDWAPWPEV